MGTRWVAGLGHTAGKGQLRVDPGSLVLTSRALQLCVGRAGGCKCEYVGLVVQEEWTNLRALEMKKGHRFYRTKE